MKLLRTSFVSLFLMFLFASCDFKTKMNELLSPEVSTEEFKADFKTLVELGAVGGSLSVESMRGDYLAEARKGVTLSEAEAMVAEYLSGHGITDFADVVSPYYDDYIADGDIAFLAEQYGSDEGRRAVANIAKANKSLVSFVNDVLSGKKVSRNAVTGDYPEDYKSKFDSYYVVSNSDSVLNDIMNQFETVAKLSKNNPIKEKSWPLYKALAKTMYPKVMLNEFYGVVAAADLDFFIATLSSEPGKKLMQGDAAILDDVIKVRLVLNQKFSAWLRARAK